VSRYRHVDAMKAEGFAVRAACEAAEVSSSSYYEWKEKEVAGQSAITSSTRPMARRA
jgi:hypothetical protein